jgi:16S rRNA (uracil1498-N3)-methyltransferase
MNIFYSNNINKSNKRIIILDQENSHLIKVLRKKTGDNVNITDGKGFLYNCSIIESDKNKSILKIENSVEFKNELPKLKVAIALTKKRERFEWFLEKATEIGISEITPVICRHSEKNRFNLERSKKILVSAMKQSLRYTLPVINKPVNFKDYITSNSENMIDSFIATCLDRDVKLLKKKLIKGNDSLIMIGPEGGFSENEINSAKKAKFVPVSLGNSRLRTETAGVVACSIFSTINYR